MHFEVIPTFQKIKPFLTENKICVVIDTLRATSTIVTAFQHGCKEIIPTDSLQKAESLYKKSKFILGGESGGEPLPIFLKGNSPLEYTKGMENQSMIFITTNGTHAITKLKGAKYVVICSLLNIGAVVKWLKKCNEDKAVICCAGTRGRLALEDFYTAGGIMERMANTKSSVSFSSFAYFAKNFYAISRKRYNGDIRKMLQNSLNGKRLIEIGMLSDLDFCCRENVYDILPFYADGVIKLAGSRDPDRQYCKSKA